MAELALTLESLPLREAALARLRLGIEDLGPEQLTQACAAAFLLHPALEQFMAWELPRLLRHLRSVSERRLVDDRRVDGHVHWPATLEARGRGGPGRFVVRKSLRRYDLLENQLLQYLLQQVERGLQGLPESLRQGACYAGPRGEATPTILRLSRLTVALARARRDGRLSKVTPLPRAEARALLRARDTGMPAYAELADTCELARALIEAPSAAALRAATHAIVPLPVPGQDALWARIALSLSEA